MKRRTKGNGAIYYDEKRKRYIGQIQTGFDENGKRKRKTVYGSTKSEVQNKLKNIEFQVFTGTFTDRSEITLYHLAKQILDEKLNQNEIKEPTYFRHCETLKILKPIYNTPIQEMHETQIRHFLAASLGYSQSVINKIYGLLNRTLKEAVRRKIITENPIEGIKRPNAKKPTVKVRALTIGEQKKLMHVLQTEDINYSRQMLLSLSLGLRMGEVNALCVEDINFDFNRLTVHRTISKGEHGEPIVSDTTKTKAGTRTLILTPSVKALLKDCALFKDSGFIFMHNNRLITTSQVNEQFKRVCKKYDIIDKTITDGKVDLHSLRHTFGTRCAEADMPPKVLQEIMGHTDIKITMNTYFYATRDYIKDNVNRIESMLKNQGLTVNTPTADNSIILDA